MMLTAWTVPGSLGQARAQSTSKHIDGGRSCLPLLLHDDYADEHDYLRLRWRA